MNKHKICAKVRKIAQNQDLLIIWDHRVLYRTLRDHAGPYGTILDHTGHTGPDGAIGEHTLLEKRRCSYSLDKF